MKPVTTLFNTKFEELGFWELKIGNSWEEQAPWSKFHIFNYWDGVDWSFVRNKLNQIYEMTGEQIYNILSGKRKIFCGGCHETRERTTPCLATTTCVYSALNTECLHADNAMFWNVLDSILYTLSLWNLITQEEYIEYSAWMRAISHFKLELDWEAPYQTKDILKPWMLEILQNYNPSWNESLVERNKFIQKWIAQKYDQFIIDVLAYINYKMQLPWKRDCSIKSEILAIAIKKRRNEIIPNFFTQDAPKIPEIPRNITSTQEIVWK